MVRLDKHPKSTKSDEIYMEDASSSNIATTPKTPSRVVVRNHPQNQIIGDKNTRVLTRRQAKLDGQAQLAKHVFC